jgi:putative FmdB family regulatory protein
MPLYEFRCRECDREFVLAVRIEDRDRTSHRCPRCGSGDLERSPDRCETVTSKGKAAAAARRAS